MAPSSSDAPNDSKTSTICYAYMFEKDKRPTKQLDALLRSIARHISREVGDRSKRELTPQKLAAFYKAVGGDYDSLFVQTDNPSISTVWKITGCQHTLQPTENDFEFPSVPALTPRGFSRWESLEILLGPEEHVPFMQYAVKNWNLKHPETGEPFPTDLPSDVFPAQADADVDRWHESCAANLWREASKEDLPKMASPEPAPNPDSKYAFFHASPLHPEPPPTARPAQRRPFSYVHVPGRAGPRLSTRSPERRRTPPDERERARRRSFSDYASPTHEPRYPATHLDPKRPTVRRGHSQPRHHSSTSDDEPLSPPRLRRRQHPSPPSPIYNRRHVPPVAPHPPPAVATSRSQRPVDGVKRRGAISPLGNLRDRLSEKVSSFFPGGSAERPLNESRQGSYTNSPRPRKPPQRPRPAAFSDIDSEEISDADDSDDHERRRSDEQRRRSDNETRRRPRVRGNHRPRGRPDGEPDGDSTPPRRQHLRRPETYRRTSSHADIDRRRAMPAAWERMRVGRRSPEPLTGVGGRRYPEAAY